MNEVSMRIFGTVVIGALFSAIAWSASAQPLRIEAESGAATLLRLSADEFRATRDPTFAVAVDIDNASAGFAKLCDRQILAFAASRAMTVGETNICAQQKANIVQLPLALNAIVVVVSPRNSWAKQISLAQLRAAWRESPSKAGSWSDLDPGWPSSALKLYGPTTKVGLSANYASALELGDSTALRRDMAATDVLGVVADAVARDQAALGILDLATYHANQKRVRALRISSATAEAPLQYRLTLYVNAQGGAAPGLKDFLVFSLANAERFATAAALRALNAAEYERATARVAEIR